MYYMYNMYIFTLLFRLYILVYICTERCTVKPCVHFYWKMYFKTLFTFVLNNVLRNPLYICTVWSSLFRYPGGWKNVRSLHFCCSNTSLPLYLTSRTAQEVGKVETFNFAKNVKKSVRDELSTIPGATVIVHPSGDVKLKRSAGQFLMQTNVSYL